MVILTEIVKRAMVHTLTDIGQIDIYQRRQLNRAVKVGYLSKGKGGPFPILKTVYAHPGFDFESARKGHIVEFQAWHTLDVARGVVSK